MDLNTSIGSLGAFLTLVGFLLNQFHKLNSDSLIYDLINFFGSLLLFIYAILLYSIPFAILNGIWMLSAFRDIFVDFKKKKLNS